MEKKYHFLRVEIWLLKGPSERQLHGKYSLSQRFSEEFKGPMQVALNEVRIWKLWG